MNNELIAELLENADILLREHEKQIAIVGSDEMAYPNMQNTCLLMQTIAQLRQAYSLLAIEQDLQYITRQLDGFRQNGFPVESIHSTERNNR